MGVHVFSFWHFFKRISHLCLTGLQSSYTNNVDDFTSTDWPRSNVSYTIAVIVLAIFKPVFMG